MNWKDGKATTLLILGVSLACACADGVRSNREPEKPSRILASGKRVAFETFEIDRESYDGPALVLEYQTEIALQDYLVLQDEVEEIWLELMHDDILEQVEIVYIVPMQGPVDANTFVMSRTENGTWRRDGGFVDTPSTR